MLLFIDTETTGMIKWKLPTDHASQPRMVQLAAVLCDQSGDPLTQFSTLIKPDGWMIEDEAARIHGISTEDCEECGLPVVLALSVLSELCDRAGIIVAHNIDFDSKIIDGEYKRAGHAYGFGGRIGDRQLYCTMKAATSVCKLPGRYGDYKWPKLAEAYRHFFDKEISRGHMTRSRT